ncbi:MAG: PIN domain-containing protein [Clostridia bacterium]|nr:PIN domain-containing protein [Clostridia bacterium]
MKNKVLIDTPIWIDYFKNKDEIADSVDKLIDSNLALTVGPIIAELLQGAKSEKDRKLLTEAISSITYLDCSMEDWVKAGNICSDLRKKGITVPLIDALIAAVSIKARANVFSHDKHFELIPAVELYK